MTFFEWKDEYSIGVPHIDQQHKKLISLVDQLYTSMEQGRAEVMVRHILNELIDYTKTHFAAEEAVMRANRYPDFTNHKDEHVNLTIEVLSYNVKFENDYKIVVPLSVFLKEWLTRHILDSDKRFGLFLEAKAKNQE